MMLVLGASTSFSADYVRQGKTFIVKQSKKSGSGTYRDTGFTWEINGTQYPIYVSESGSCFIIKVSKKTGKPYRQYLGKDVSAQICKELGLTYKRK